MMHFFLFIFLTVFHTANGTAKTLLEVNGTKISERVFRDYAEYLYKDEYFLVHNTKLKKQMVIDNIINNVLTSQKLIEQQKIDYSKDELNALSHIIHGSFFKKEIKQVIKLNEKSKISLPKTIINYYKIVFSDTIKATATLNELKNNFKTLKNQNEKLQAFKNTGKSSLTSETMIIGPILISDLNDLTEQESVLLKKKEEGLVNKVIGNKFESQLIFVFRVISDPVEIKRVIDYTDGENLRRLKIKKFLDHAKSEANIIINQKQIDKFEF